jgi:predicted TPR repeat methyltransferase
MEAHRAGRLDEAEPLYRGILERQPADADALHFLGLLTHSRGDTTAAIELVRRSTEHAPGYFDAHNNLGNLLKLAGRFEDAEAAYLRALELRPNDANAHSNLGVVLKTLGKLTEAQSHLMRAIDLDGRHVAAYTNLGHLLKRQGRKQESLACYRAAIAVDPTNPNALKMLGIAYQANGQLEAAREIFQEWHTREPDNPVAAHMLRAASGGTAPSRAADAYVRALFDELADGFDEHLADLGYRAPALVAQAFLAAWPAARGELDVLDAGCGTGLCGAFLRPYARTLTGVDLSGGMLRRAAQLGLYDRLVEGELTRYLRASTAAHDAIVSADTLCYFGALAEMFEAAAGALKAGGRLIFTLEKADGDAPEGYRLELHGRYSHAEAYVRAQLERAGLAIDAISTGELRMESGKPVTGLIVAASRPPG